MPEETPCPRCGGAKRLNQAAIASIYLAPHWWALVIILAGIVLALAKGSRWWLLVSLLGYLLPLSMADLRLLLYPWVALGNLLGREVNCPTCNPGSTIFKRKS